ncbi:MAG: endonuclease/exonuclease/phosphatase family protein [Proteobacteria bacterium]|nr:endonuclease/exonuclease/phosphatase family protein [Pseudomonadota bacterium]
MKLITWNIQSCRGCDGKVSPQRIVEHARTLADFDVLCLQEVAANMPALPGSQGENQFELLAALLPRYAAIPGAAVDTLDDKGHRRVFGNLILSRYPVLQVLRHQLPWPVDAAVTSMPRLLIEATLDTPLGPLRVMTTHLEYYSDRQRAAQVEAIRQAHAQACAHANASEPRDSENGPFHWYPKTTAAILTGDFNFKPDDPLHDRLQAPIDADTPPLLDLWPQLHPGQPQPDTIGVHDHEQWPEAYACDFILASADLLPRVRQVRVDSATSASDHQPMLVCLE